MRAVLLCPGPSLRGAGELDLSPWDTSIGVNEAVEWWPVDWWSYCDKWVPVRFIPVRTPRGIFTVDGQRLAYANNVAVTKLTSSSIKMIGSANWTTIRSFSLAHHLGATTLDVFGADMVPEDELLRGKKRFELERVQFQVMVGEFAKLGMEIIRHEDCSLLSRSEPTRVTPGVKCL